MTSKAAQQLRNLMKTQGEDMAIKVGVRTQGCSGLTYTLDYIPEKDIPSRGEVVQAEGVKVFVHPKALFSIIGSEMDFHQSKLGSEFVFTNPNAQGTCGCGESFMV